MFRKLCATVIIAVFLLSGFAETRVQAAGQISGRWHGQDKHDYCGEATNAIKPNGVQDIHVTIGGLPPHLAIANLRINGHGADEWKTTNLNQFGVMVVRKPGATSADLFFEPLRVETGRGFAVTATFSDGSEAEAFLDGGRANPNLRMPGDGIIAKWVGQEKVDLSSLATGVGPDGLIDARINLAKLSPKDRIKSIDIDDPKIARWSFGTNPKGSHNAEFVPNSNDPTSGELFFQPDRDLSGRRLSVTVTYESGKEDTAVVAAGKCDQKLATAKATLPKLGALTLTSKWHGQDGGSEKGSGDVHVTISGLNATKSIAAAVLSDPVRGLWIYRAGGERSGFDVDSHALPMAIRRGTTRSSAELYFPPVRDESMTTLSLRLIYSDGESAVGSITGGSCDVAKRAPAIASTETVAKPGDDLNTLANRFGTVRLGAGDYRLLQPLVLNRPVTITGEPGAVLTFAQGAAEPPWTTAIKIHSGGTTLKGFSIRFAGPIRWKHEVSWSPAVIGTTDNLDSGPHEPKVNLVFEKLDIAGPPSAMVKPWEEAPKLFRLVNATSGRVVGNTLRGGVSEFFEGPWVIDGNDYRGTMPGTSATAVFAVHDSHDVSILNNKAKPIGPSGKTWRFLVFTVRGAYDRVENNIIERIGPRDDDTIPYDNQPEIILTESYHVRFEGKPAAVSADGRLIKVGKVPGEHPRIGDVVSVVGGAAAGSWRRIVQKIEPGVYLVETPFPKGADVISITPGFVHEHFIGNTIDARGGSKAAGFVLSGNHFSTRLVNNKIIGPGEAFQIYAYASESPNIWGWTHVPFFGGVIEGNTIEDSERGGVIGVFHSPATKSNRGRVYMTASLKGNTVRWTEPFLNKLAVEKKPAVGIRLGFPGALEPGEFLAEESDTRLEAPPRAMKSTALKIESAVVNKKPSVDRAGSLPVRASSSTSSNARSAGPTGGPSRR